MFGKKAGLTFLSFALMGLCTTNEACSSEPTENKTTFSDYWYSGKAEITRYELEQTRYGETRKGDAVLIFVTEDFWADRQVKYEFGDKSQTVPVLKLNFTRKFYTGIYPYSVMSSIFTPVDFTRRTTLKTTSSSQEWCGHTFTQLNNRGQEFDVQLRSYFQAEGDKAFKLDSAFLEDEIWTRIRLAPESLPTGEIEIIPGSQFTRFRHVPLKVELAEATLATITNKNLSANTLAVYTLHYKDLNRTLKVTYETTFPYQILAWEETYSTAREKNAKKYTTKAVKTHTLRTDYWSKNKLSDSHLRDELGIIY